MVRVIRVKLGLDPWNGTGLLSLLDVAYVKPFMTQTDPKPCQISVGTVGHK